MGLFFNKNQFKQKQNLLNMLDELYMKSKQIDLPSLNNEIIKVRKSISSRSLTKKQIQSLEEKLQNLKNHDIKSNKLHFKQVMSNLLEVINNQQDYADKNQKVMSKNQDELAKVIDEIDHLNAEIIDAQLIIDESLKNNTKSSWLIHTQRKKVAIQKTILLQQDLEKLISKNASIDVSKQVGKSSLLTKDLQKQSQSLNLDDIAYQLETNTQNYEDIMQEGNNLEQMILGQSNETSSFERAREQYILEFGEQEKNNSNKHKDKENE